MVFALIQIEKAFEVFDKSGMIPVKCEKTRKTTRLRVLLVSMSVIKLRFRSSMHIFGLSTYLTRMRVSWMGLNIADQANSLISRVPTLRSLVLARAALPNRICGLSCFLPNTELGH